MHDIWYRKSIFYFISLGIAVIASFKTSISYALLNIFIPEEKLPLELGVAKIVGEYGARIVNIITDTTVWFILIIIGYHLYKHLGKKKFIVFLILSPAFWLIVSYSIFLINSFVFGNFEINIFVSCPSSGYPIYRETCQESVLNAFYFLNMFFWFLVIWFIWEQILKRFHRIIMLTQKS